VDVHQVQPDAVLVIFNPSRVPANAAGARVLIEDTDLLEGVQQIRIEKEKARLVKLREDELAARKARRDAARAKKRSPTEGR